MGKGWMMVKSVLLFFKMYLDAWVQILWHFKWCSSFTSEGSNAFNSFSLAFSGWELANMYAEYSESQKQGVANAAPSYNKILRTPPHPHPRASPYSRWACRSRLDRFLHLQARRNLILFSFDCPLFAWIGEHLCHVSIFFVQIQEFSFIPPISQRMIKFCLCRLHAVYPCTCTKLYCYPIRVLQ